MGLAELGAAVSRALTLLVATMAVAAMAGCAAHNQSPLPPASNPPNQVVTAPPSVPLPAAPALPPPQTSVEPAPFAIAAGPDGNLWFTEFRAHRIGSITTQGSTKPFELSVDVLPERLTAGPDDAIWFTDPAGNRIGRLDLTGAQAYVPLRTENSGPAGITLGRDGNLWFTDMPPTKSGASLRWEPSPNLFCRTRAVRRVSQRLRTAVFTLRRIAAIGSIE